VVLDELRQWGDNETLDKCIDGYLTANKPDELYGKVLERWEEDFESKNDPGLVRNAMILLWSARKGLSEPELMDLLGNPPRAIWSPLQLAAEAALVRRSGQLAFAHDYLRAAVETRYLTEETEQKAAHNRIAAYFEKRPSDARKVDELPWQLSRCQEWKWLYDVLADLEFFAAAWKRNKYEVMGYWVEVENHTRLNRVDAYRSVIEGLVEGRSVEWGIAKLLHDTGHLEEAMGIRSRQIDRSRQEGDLDGLQASLGNQALILQDRCQLDDAMALHKEQERICKQLGNLDGLQASLGNQALILEDRGKLNEAMSFLKEVERICKQLGNLDGLQRSLGNQAGMLYARGQLDEAMALVKEVERICKQLGNLEGLSRSFSNQARIHAQRGQRETALRLALEAEDIAQKHGFTALLAQIRPIVAALRNQND